MRTHSNFMHNQLLSPLLSKSRENNYMQQTARNLTSKSQNVGLRSTLILPPIINPPPLYHLYITSSPPTPNPSTEPYNHTIAWVHETSSHSPLHVLTYFQTYWSLSRRPTDSGLRWNRKNQQTLSQEKKADYIHSQRAWKESSKNNPDRNTQTAQRTRTFFKLHSSLHRPHKPSEWTSFHHKTVFTSRDVILKHTYRLDAAHAGHTNQTTSTQTLPSPNALVLSPTTTPLTFIPRQPTNHPTCTHKTPQRQINHRVPSNSRILQHPPLQPPLHPTIKTKKSAANMSMESHHNIQKNHDISQNDLIRKVSSKTRQIS